MKKLLKHLRAYRKECVLAPLFKMLEVCFELCVPLIIAAMIDIGIAEASKRYIIVCCGILLALGILGLSATLIAQYYSARAACGFAQKVKACLFHHIGELSYKDLDQIGTSRLLTSMTSDINQVQSGVNLTLRLLLRSPMVVLGAVVMAFTVNASAAVSFVIVIPILSAIVFGIMLCSVPLYKKVQTALDRVLGRTRENLGGVRVIRAFGQEDEEISAFREENEKLTKAQKFVGRISALLNPMTYIVINLGIVLLLWRSAHHVNSGDLTDGQVIALWNYMSQILVELIKLANLIITMTKATACGNRIQALLDILPSQSYPDTAPEENMAAPAVAFYGVSLNYHKDASPALSALSFSVERGMTVGVIGGTGSGKTSLINLIPRFYDATEGEVLLNGCAVQSYPKELLLKKIGIVPQKPVLFSGTIRDNLRFGKADATDEECMEAIRLAQATDIILGKDGGLDYVIEEGGRNLSGGQRQRLTIARALVGDPEILLLDDAASALDFATDAALRRALATKTDATVFIVSQRISSVRHADMILVLDDGCIVGKGSHEELLASCEVYREIYESQHKGESEHG